MSKLISEDERLDDLEIKGYKIIQNKNMFCFGIDAVLLSDFAKIKKNENVIDMCTGNGIIPLLMCAKDKGNKYIAIDINDKNIDMARRSVEYNNLSEKINVVCEDIKNTKDFIKKAEYNVITCNPPYMSNNTGYKNLNDDMLIARHEILCDINDILKAAASVLDTKGRVYMIHRPNRLVDIIDGARKHRLEPKRMTFVHSYVGKKPSMVLIEFIKDGKPNLIIEEPLIVYEKNGEYTESIKKIYGNK